MEETSAAPDMIAEPDEMKALTEPDPKMPKPTKMPKVRQGKLRAPKAVHLRKPESRMHRR